MIAAYLNAKTDGGRTFYGMQKRQVIVTHLPGGKKKITKKPLEDDVITTDEDGRFEFQDIPENIKFARELILETKTGIPKIEMEDDEDEERIIGSKVEEDIEEIIEDDGDVTFEEFKPRFSPKGHKVSPANLSNLERARAVKAKNDAKRKADKE